MADKQTRRVQVPPSQESGTTRIIEITGSAEFVSAVVGSFTESIGERLGSVIADRVTALFTQESAVNKIYWHNSAQKLSFWIFTDNETYDDALMRRLLKSKYHIEDTSDTFDFEFEFIPCALIDEPSDVVPEKAQLLYTRT